MEFNSRVCDVLVFSAWLDYKSVSRNIGIITIPIAPVLHPLAARQYFRSLLASHRLFDSFTTVVHLPSLLLLPIDPFA